MTQYVSFTVDIEGDTAYFSVPAEKFEEFRAVARRLCKKMSALLEEGIEKYGFSADIMTKIIRDNKIVL